MMEELKAKSAFHQQIAAQVKEYTPVLTQLGQLINDFSPSTELEMREFGAEMEVTRIRLRVRSEFSVKTIQPRRQGSRPN